MPALVRKKQPVQFFVYAFLVHPHQFIGEIRQICRVLITASVYRGFSWQVVPLLACHLAASAGCTNTCIDKK
jgi:hypothetical protein